MRELLILPLVLAASVLMAGASMAASSAPTLDPRLADLRSHAREQLTMLAALPAVCVQKHDTDEVVFHGCIDWHSSAHGNWALMAYAALTKDHQYDHLVDDALTADGIAAERRKLANQPYFEMPYGRAWFLRLAIAHGKRHGKTYVTDMADDVARSIYERYRQTGPRPFELEYANPAWAMINLLDYLEFRKTLPTSSSIDAVLEQARAAFRHAKIGYSALGVDRGSLVVHVTDKARIDEARSLLAPVAGADITVDRESGVLAFSLRETQPLPDRAALTPLMRPFLSALVKCSLEDERKFPQFMSICGNWAALLAEWLPPDEARAAIDKLVPDVDAAMPVETPVNAHHYGLNYTRAWSAWIVYSRTSDKRWGEMFARHMEFMNAHPDWYSFDYNQVGHWVAQFGMFAWERFLTDPVRH